MWQEKEHDDLYLVRYKLVRLAEVLQNKMREGQNEEGEKDEKRERIIPCAPVRMYVYDLEIDF